MKRQHPISGIPHSLFIYSTILCSSLSITAQNLPHLTWSVPASLPGDTDQSVDHPGVAGAFIGVSNGMLLIAGGSNFPKGMPWEGGKKIYHAAVYVMDLHRREQHSCRRLPASPLNTPIAYGASVQVDDALVAIGGENEQGITDQVQLLRWDATLHKLQLTALPRLPRALTNLMATSVNHHIYIAGGESAEGVSSACYSLDLDHLAFGWKTLPALPKPVSHAVLLAQANEKGHSQLYLIGGRKKNPGAVSEFYASVYAFDLATQQWIEKAPLPYALSAAAGVSLGKAGLLILGGDKGETFQRVEALLSRIISEKDPGQKASLVEQKNNTLSQHPGFSRDVLQYTPETDQWKCVDLLPNPAPVTTVAVLAGQKIYLPCGEIRAGVRSPAILEGVLQFSANEK